MTFGSSWSAPRLACVRCGTLLATCVLWAGCNNAPTPPTIRSVDTFPAGGTTPAGGWESAGPPSEVVCEAPPDPEDKTWTEFEAGEVLEVRHGLGRTPSLIMPYLAFEQSGCRATLGVGDMARIESADDQAVFIRNRTEQKFFLRLVLQ